MPNDRDCCALSLGTLDMSALIKLSISLVVVMMMMEIIVVINVGPIYESSVLVVSRSPIHHLDETSMNYPESIKDIPTEICVDIFRSQQRVTRSVYTVDALIKCDLRPVVISGSRLYPLLP